MRQRAQLGESALRRARLARGDTPAAAARRIGVNPLTYLLWERGLLLPDLRWARSIAGYVGLGLADVCAVLLKLHGQLHPEQYLVIRRRNRREALPQWPQPPLAASPPSRAREKRLRTPVLRLGTALAAASLAVGSLGAAASVGALPDPLQHVLAQTALALGIHLPDAKAPAVDDLVIMPRPPAGSPPLAGGSPTPGHPSPAPHTPQASSRSARPNAAEGAPKGQPAAPEATRGSAPPAPPAATPPAAQPPAVPAATPSPTPSQGRETRTIGAPSERPTQSQADRARAGRGTGVTGDLPVPPDASAHPTPPDAGGGADQTLPLRAARRSL